MRKSIVLALFLISSLSISAQKKVLQDTLNIPVILVDGVEVQSLDSVCKEDIVEVKVIGVDLKKNRISLSMIL